MVEFENNESLAEAIQNDLGLIKPNHLIGINGKDGVGKTSLANGLALLLGANVISLDDYIEKNKDTYVDVVCLEALQADLESCSTPMIVEGVCLLDIIDRSDKELSKMIYIKRVSSYGYWRDEDVCNPTDDPELVISKEEKSLRLFIKLTNDKSDTNDNVSLSGLTKELIRYHAQYRPSTKADYIYLRKQK